jgi:hypothetical protein
MASLLHDIRRAASPKAERSQQIMQLGQRGNGHPWRTELQSRASNRVEHPARHDDHDPRRRLDVDDLTARRLFAAVLL